MRIMAILPGDFPPEEIQARQKYLQAVASPGTRVVVVGAEGPFITSTYDFYLLIPGILKRVKEAEKKGFDAVVIHCSGDPGLDAAMAMTHLPVVGGGKTAYHVASLLADRFGVITNLRTEVPYMQKLARIYDMTDLITSIKSVDMSILELRSKKAELRKRFLNLSREAIEEGAELIVPGCLAILPALGVGASEELSKKLGVPVLDASAVTIRTAEMLADLKLSKRVGA